MNHKNKIYFFPAVLPLLAVVPWLLTAFGTLSGIIIGILSRKRSARFKSIGFLGTALIFLAAGIFFWPAIRLRYLDKGTYLTSKEHAPRTEFFASIGTSSSLPQKHGAAWDIWKPIWFTSTKRRSLSNPVISGPLAIVGTWEGTVDAYDIDSGMPIWAVKKKEPVISLTGASEKLLLAGEGLHTAPSASLTAISLPDGNVLWDRVFQGHLESPAAYSPETQRIWIGTGPAGLWCLNAIDGSVLWHKADVHVDSTPLLANGKVYFSGQESGEKKESVFFSLDQNSGKENWRLTIPGQPWGSPMLDSVHDQIITTSGIGQIGIVRETDRGWAHAISLKDRKLLWSVALAGNPLETGIMLDKQGLVIISVQKGEILALDTNSGRQVWSSQLGDQIVSEPDIDQQSQPPRLVSLAANGKLRLQSALTGRFLDEHDFVPGNNSSPRFLHDGILLALPSSIARYQW